jgi:hypothetical protein
MTARVTPLAAVGPVLLVPAVLAVLAACGPTERAGTPPRHVVLVTVDTLRADRMSAWRHPRATTDLAGVLEATGEHPPTRPSLDRLAAEGVAFASAFAPRGMTFPSLATLFTGRPPLEHGAIDNRDRLCGDVATLAATLAGAGFATAGFVTNPLLARGSGIERGFDHYDDRHVDRAVDRDLLAVSAASEWLLEQDLVAGPRLFLWLHLMGPHMPYEPLPLEDVDYATLFVDPAYDGPADGSREFLDEAYRSGRELTAADVEHVRAIYDGEIARIDHLVSLFAEVLSGALPAQPVDVLGQSIFAFAADHGEELAQRHGYWAHSKSVYASVLHVPLFLRHPASLTGRRVMGEAVELQDVMPTLLDWLEVPSPPGVAGRSLLPLVDGGPFPSRDAFGTWRDRVFTVRSDRWRLVWNPDGVEPDDPPAGPYPIPELQLFDVEADPLELRDVAAEHAAVVEDLRGRITAWREGLDRACAPGGELSPERRAALEDVGYLEPAEDGAE